MHCVAASVIVARVANVQKLVRVFAPHLFEVPSVRLFVALPIYNRPLYAMLALEALRASAYDRMAVDVVVFDDHSTTFAFRSLKEWTHGMAVALQNDAHLGAPRNAVRAMRHFLSSTTHTHFMLVDSDMVVARDWHAHVLNALEMLQLGQHAADHVFSIVNLHNEYGDKVIDDLIGDESTLDYAYDKDSTGGAGTLTSTLQPAELSDLGGTVWARHTVEALLSDLNREDLARTGKVPWAEWLHDHGRDMATFALVPSVADHLASGPSHSAPDFDPHTMASQELVQAHEFITWIQGVSGG